MICEKQYERNKYLKTNGFLSFCLTASLFAACGGTAVNNNANAPATNNAAANKPVAASTNQAAPTPKPSETPQAAKVNFDGLWNSERFNKKGNKYTELSLYIEQNGDTVNGTYSVDSYVGEEWQGDDGNLTPFTGTIKEGVATIKFDPEATVPGYEEHVKYKEPASGNPSTATLTLSGKKLEWKLTGGASPSDVPKDVSLGKAKSMK